MTWHTRTVAGIGIVGIDHIAVTDRWERDAKTKASHYFEQVGGPVPVALCAMARLGLEIPPRFYSVVGADSAAGTIRRTLTEDGADVSPIRTTIAHPTGHSVVVLDTTDGTRTLTNFPGPGLDDLGSDFASLSDVGLLHLDGSNVALGMAAAAVVHAGGGLVSLDLGSMRLERHSLFPHCDILITSEVGGTGAWPEHANDPVAQTRRFLEMGARVAGVTLGGRGCVIAARDGNGGEPVFLPAFAASNVIDTCGAGDLFHGAFLWAYRSGKTVIDAAQFAQAAVALRISHYGNRAGQPSRAAVEAFLNDQFSHPIAR